MNVIVANERRYELNSLNIEIIKNVEGVYSVEELIGMFTNFFFNRIIIDITSIKNYNDYSNLKKLFSAIDTKKIIILLNQNHEVCISKEYISDLVTLGVYNFTVLGDFDILNLTYLENDGALFGSFSGMRWILVAVTAALMIFGGWYMIKHSKEKLTLISMTLIISGGLGNIIDRLFRDGKVVDYFDVQFMDFAVFNFADCCVVIGVILLLIQIVFFDFKDKGEKVNKEKVSENE